jgi:glycosyltransferase involved in cell wall biosynthesis
MKILDIVPYIPYPPDNGARIVVSNTVRELTLLGNTVLIASILNPPNDKPIPTESTKMEGSFIASLDKRNLFITLVSSAITGIPYTFMCRWSPITAQKLLMFSDQTHIDVILADHLHTLQYALYLKHNLGIPVAYRAHNIETTIWQKYANSRNNLLVKMAATIEAHRVKLYEARLVAQADQCLMISSDELNLIKQMSPKSHCTLAGSGVDTSYYAPFENQEESAILFIGGLDWHPNVDAVLWFVSTIFPSIAARIPEVHFYVVGKNPPQDVISLANDRITITGYVADDRAYFARSTVVVIPMRQGAGIKVKALTSMAMGKALVSTSYGVSGLSIRHGCEALISDDPQKFADYVVELLTNPTLRSQLGQSGRRLALQKYNWAAVGKVINAVLHQILEG